MKEFKLNRVFSYFGFCCQWLGFDICICFISWHFDRNYEFWSRYKNLKITAGIKNLSVSYQEKKKKHEKIVLLVKKEINTIKIIISKVLVDSYISYDKFVSVNNVSREYNEMKQEMKNSEIYILYKYGWYKQKNGWKKWCRKNSG